MHVNEWARRHAPTQGGDNVIDSLREGASLDETARRHGFPPAKVRGVQQYYDLLRHPGVQQYCTGTACAFARAPGESIPPGAATVCCVGRCYEAPARLEEGSFPIPRSSLVAEPAVFRHLLGGARPSLTELYRVPSGEQVLARIEASGLRGRGGAAFPTAAKWKTARQVAAPVKYVVANGDEGDPGSFVDRLLLEEAPHAVLAGMNACAAAIGATHGIVYVRGEYPYATSVMRRAIGEATRAGVLFPGFSLSVHQGAGSYVCGEETALLRAIEGQRAESQPKPPYPAERGLFGMPTVVQNVETLALVPWLLERGGRATTKGFSLSGAVARPGAVEAPLGISLDELLREGAGGPAPGKRWKLALIGGPMGAVLPAERFDTAMAYETYPGLGHGGVVVLDDSVNVRRLALHLYEFAAAESCGNCAPCRLATAQLAGAKDRAALERLCDTLELGSLCGFGQGVPRPIRDLLKYFPGEVFDGVAGGAC